MASPSELEPGQQVSEQRPTRKRAFRFKVHHDVHLLKEVMVHQPWAALPHRDIKAKWKMIADGVSNYAKCPARPVATRRRFDALIAAFRNKQMDLLRAAGAEEEFDERARLLANVEQQVGAAFIRDRFDTIPYHAFRSVTPNANRLFSYGDRRRRPWASPWHMRQQSTPLGPDRTVRAHRRMTVHQPSDLGWMMALHRAAGQTSTRTWTTAATPVPELEDPDIVIRSRSSAGGGRE